MKDGKAVEPIGFAERGKILEPEDRYWFERRRAAHPPERVEARPVTRLPLSLLREGEVRDLASLIPRDAPRSHAAPRPGPGRSLRRFDGTRVEPCNFTQLFNGESRATYGDTSWPWVCIGRVDLPGGIYGSATLVGRSVILTASHVLDGLWRPGGPLASGVTFTPASYDGRSLLGADWTANVINVAVWESVDDVVGYDMAVCQLDQPMGEWLGGLGAIGYDDDWEDRHVWTHCGYPYDMSPKPDIPDRPCYQLGVAVFDDDSDDFDTLELETKADIASCQSGGPLFADFTDGQTRVIGTLSGRSDHALEEKCSLFAGGNGLVRLIKWGRDNYN